MRSTDARWHLAVEALARMPELTGRLLEVHQADGKGYCRGCTVPGGTLFARWPCGLNRLATAAAAAPYPAPSTTATPAAPDTTAAAGATAAAGTTATQAPRDLEPSQRYAFGVGRRSAFGPGRRAPDRPPTGSGG